MTPKNYAPTAYDAAAYEQREKGCSPEPICNAVWQIVGPQVRGTVLDAGSGAGAWILRLQQSAAVKHIISVDLVDDGAGQIKGVEFYRTDLSRDRLPCAEASLDWIFALEVLEHLANPRHFVAEAHRCLRTGGKLFLTTPCNDCLTAKLSFLFRGYFPAFCEHDYHGSGHITPITELDMRRMAQEAGFRQIGVHYPLPGRMPKMSLEWQSLFPFLQGKWWSDSLFAMLTK